MVDLTTAQQKLVPPDRRLLSTLTNDPKIIRYLEQIGSDAPGSSQAAIDLLFQLIIDTAEVANSAQGSANIVGQVAQGLELLIQHLEGIGLLQTPLIQGMAGRLDDLEGQLLELRPAVTSPVFSPSVSTQASTYSVPSAQAYQPITVRANAAAAGFTVTLPSAPGALQLVNVKKIDATANVVTISGGAINIDGAATKTITAQYVNVQIQFNGATWDIL